MGVCQVFEFDSDIISKGVGKGAVRGNVKYCHCSSLTSSLSFNLYSIIRVSLMIKDILTSN